MSTRTSRDKGSINLTRCDGFNDDRVSWFSLDRPRATMQYNSWDTKLWRINISFASQMMLLRAMWLFARFYCQNRVSQILSAMQQIEQRCLMKNIQQSNRYLLISSLRIEIRESIRGSRWISGSRLRRSTQPFLNTNGLAERRERDEFAGICEAIDTCMLRLLVGRSGGIRLTKRRKQPQSKAA